MTYKQFREEIKKMKEKTGKVTIEPLDIEIPIIDVDFISTLLYPIFFDYAKYDDKHVDDENHFFEKIKRAYDIISDFDKYPRIIIYGQNTKKRKNGLKINYKTHSYLEDNLIILDDQIHYSLKDYQNDINYIIEFVTKNELSALLFMKNAYYLISFGEMIKLKDLKYFNKEYIEVSYKLGCQLNDFIGAYLLHNIDLKEDIINYLLNDDDKKLLMSLVKQFADSGLDLNYLNKNYSDELKTINSKTENYNDFYELLNSKQIAREDKHERN